MRRGECGNNNEIANVAYAETNAIQRAHGCNGRKYRLNPRHRVYTTEATDYRYLLSPETRERLGGGE